jgi:4a-hydroxytetrahydrobiopterin dehydratase
VTAPPAAPGPPPPATRDLLALEAVRAALASLPGWEHDEERARIKKTFKVRAFSDALGLAVRVGAFAAALDHHPDLDIRYDRVKVAYTTHTARGVTGLDIAAARAIEGLGRPI